MSKHNRWLLSEIERWTAEAIITPEQGARLRQRYAAPADGPPWGLLVFSSAGALVIGLGVILLLLVVGYLWLVQIGMERGSGSRLTALAYGVGSALTLDEFALWLNLQDVYWASEGRESIDAVVLFGAFLAMGLWGHPFFTALVREAGRWLRR